MTEREVFIAMKRRFGPNGEKWRPYYVCYNEPDCGCLMQMLWRVTGGIGDELTVKCGLTLQKLALPGDWNEYTYSAGLIGKWNDRQQWPAIEALLDRAIQGE